MPWNESSVMSEREAFVVEYGLGEASVADLCERFGISRKTGYKWLDRYEADGLPGLKDRKRAPRERPSAFGNAIRARVLELRESTGRQREVYGPAKLLHLLEQEGGWERLPAASTIALWLREAGVSRHYRKRRRAFGSDTIIDARAPNELWCIDLKGWFRVKSGQRCDPLTVTDASSRFGLLCEGVFGGPPATEHVKASLTGVFERYGLPRYMLSDNGPPFASTGFGGLSTLSVWLIRLGITPVRIVPGRPWQNGRHERFHRTLKQAVASPPATTPQMQTRALDEFVNWYNEQRPHEGLGMRCPAQLHTQSPRRFEGVPAEVHYDDGLEVRVACKDGTIRWHGQRIYLNSSLAGQAVGLLLHEDEPKATVYLSGYKVGQIDLAKGKTIPPKPGKRRLIRAGAPPPGSAPCGGPAKPDVDYEEVLPM